MFADYIKMAAKAAALIAGAAIIIVLFATIQIPNLNISQAISYISLAYTVGDHYILGFSTLWTIGMWLIKFELALLGAKLALITIKWILKVNE